MDMLAAYHNKHCWRAFSIIYIDDLKRPWISVSVSTC